MESKSTLVTATDLHSKLIMKGIVNEYYKDTHDILVSTSDGYEVLKLLMNQTHTLLAIKNITTVNIHKYSTYNSLFCYAREMKQYVKNHKMENRVFTDRDITHMFLSRLDNVHYENAVKTWDTSILHTTTIDKSYRVPAIAVTIDQLAPGPPLATNQRREQPRDHNDARSRALLDYYEDDLSHNFDNYCQEIDASGESAFCCSFRDGGGISPFSRGGGRGRQG